MRVGRHDQLALAGVRQQRAIVALREIFVAEVLGEQRGDGRIIHTYGFDRVVWSKLIATVDVNDLPTSGEK